MKRFLWIGVGLMVLASSAMGGDFEDRYDSRTGEQYRLEQRQKLIERRDRDQRLEQLERDAENLKTRERQQDFLGTVNKGR